LNRSSRIYNLKNENLNCPIGFTPAAPASGTPALD